MDTTARFNTPYAIAHDNAGNLYVAETGTPAVRKIAANGQVTTLPQSHGSGRLAIDSAGNLFILSYNPELDEESRDAMEIHKITPEGTRTLVRRYQFKPGSSNPFGIAVDGQGRIYVLSNYRNIFTISRIDADNSSRTVFEYGLPTGALPRFTSDLQGNLAILAVDEVEQDADGNLIYTDRIIIVPQASQPAKIDSPGVTFRRLEKGTGGEMVLAGDDLYMSDTVFADGAASSYRLVKIAPDGTTTILYNGFPDGSTTPRPVTDSYNGRFGMTRVGNGDFYIADPYLHAIHKITASGQVSLVAGKPGEAGSSD